MNFCSKGVILLNLLPQDLSSADFEHFGAASRTSPFQGWLAIFHRHPLWIGDFFFSAAFNAIHRCHNFLVTSFL